jgi:hypothetical protein
MSYDAIYASLERCKQAATEDSLDYQSLIEAIELLVAMLETDLTQIKMALSHNAMLLEKRAGTDDPDSESGRGRAS